VVQETPLQAPRQPAHVPCCLYPTIGTIGNWLAPPLHGVVVGPVHPHARYHAIKGPSA